MSSRSARRAGRGSEGRARADAAPSTHPPGYAEHSTDPLHILLFVLPLVLFYEAVLLFSDVSGVAETVAAHELINRFARAFGDFALYLPGLLLVAVLVAMKLARADAWRIRPRVLPLMLFESVVWAIPLLVIAALLSASPAVAVVAPPGSGAAPATAGFESLSLTGRVALSIGAGLYEELLFRLLMVSAAAFVLRSVFRISPTWASGLAIALAAMAFTFYHHPGQGGDLIARRLTYFVAGCFLGLVFVLRGFGIVVGAHAVYDLLVLVALRVDQEPA